MAGPAHELYWFPQGLGGGRLARASDGDLPARHAQVAPGGAHGDFAFEHHDLGLQFTFADANVEFSALEPCVRVGCRELQRTRIATDHVDHTADQVDQRATGLVGF